VTRILLIDDEKDIADGFQLSLRVKGFQVDAFNDPMDAISNFKPGVYDLVLCDVRMPKKSGFDVYTELKVIDEKIRICFFTAFETYNEEFSRRFPLLKADCLIRKPVTITELVAKISQVVGRESEGS
jgi:DNA-binding response OmpR family regulator